MAIDNYVLKLGIALVCGVIIGLERELKNKMAGLRTNALVAVGSAIYVLLSTQLLSTGGGDPTRVIGQVVTGIGFLGAGVILHQGISVQGLTTAATIWCSAAIGCLAASGFFAEAILSATIVVLINFLFRKVDVLVNKKKSHHTTDKS